jgi:hypothetical protein
MSTRQFAMLLGVAFLIVGALGFVPGITRMHEMPEPGLKIDGPGTGHLLGLFHVNPVHNVFHLLFGIAGITAARGTWARGYCRFVAIAYAVLAVMGAIPNQTVNTLFGLCPLDGHDIWLHALIAVVAAIFGWGVGDTEPATTTTGTTTGTAPGGPTAAPPV